MTTTITAHRKKERVTKQYKKLFELLISIDFSLSLFQSNECVFVVYIKYIVIYFSRIRFKCKALSLSCVFFDLQTNPLHWLCLCEWSHLWQYRCVVLHFFRLYCCWQLVSIIKFKCTLRCGYYYYTGHMRGESLFANSFVLEIFKKDMCSPLCEFLMVFQRIETRRKMRKKFSPQ